MFRDVLLFQTFARNQRYITNHHKTIKQQRIKILEIFYEEFKYLHNRSEIKNISAKISVLKLVQEPDVYSEIRQTSRMERFDKTING